MSHFKVIWKDAGREPQVAPNPAYPDGVDIDAALTGHPSCRLDLPYPAKRIGTYVIECTICSCRMLVTTAGRRDDPRSATVPCRPMARA